jgi:SAM-dependent methyltransferase
MADAEQGFEEIYAQAGGRLEAIPWVSLAPHPALVAWLDRAEPATGGAALVVGCGLGDDAETLSARGWRVTAFDVAPTAIALCRQRFPDSTAGYLVADLFALPEEWREAFDLVIENRTLQSLPVDQRTRAVHAIGDTVAVGGLVWVRCRGRENDEPVGARPWPVSRRELAAFADAGLTEMEFEVDGATGGGRSPSFTAVYRRSDGLIANRSR